MTTSADVRKFSRDGIRGLIILIAMGLGLVALGIAPFIWRYTLDTRLAESRDLLQVLTRDMASRSKLVFPLDQVSARAVFIKGETSGLAQAELQRLLVDRAEKTGMVIARTRLLPSDAQGQLVVFQMEVNASGRIEQLQQYLHQIETGTPLVFVKQARIATGPAVSEKGAPVTLDIQLELEAFAWLESPA